MTATEVRERVREHSVHFNYLQSRCGTGRTRAMVMALPYGATVVVHTMAMVHYVRQMIHNLRPDLMPFGVDVECVQDLNDAYRLRTGTRPLFLDHAFLVHGRPDVVADLCRFAAAQNYSPTFAAGELASEVIDWRYAVRCATIDTSIPADNAELAAAIDHINTRMREAFEVSVIGVDRGAGDESGGITFRGIPVRVTNYFGTWHETNHGGAEFEAAVWAGREADARAKSLLREWLSPEQALELDAKGHFHVTGNVTGRRYRINRGTVQNVLELGANGEPVKGWCFAPAGALAEGDVMLAQKIALETNEKAALKRANAFYVSPRGVTSLFDIYAGMELRGFEEVAWRRPGAFDSAAWTGR